MALVSRPRAPLWLGRLSRRLCAQLRACAGTMARPRRFTVELPDCSLTHFILGDPADHPDARLTALLGPPGRSYALCVPLVPGRGCGPRVQAARRHQRLLQQLRQGPLQRCQLSKLLGYGPSDQAGAIQHGFLLRDPSDHPDTRRALLQLMASCQEAVQPQLAEFQADSQGLLWQRLWELRGEGEVQVDCACVLQAPEPHLHPLLPDLLNSVVFQDRDAARAVLEECTSFIPEARAVLALVDECPKEIQKGKFQVIAIEGLDATGKTTVTQSVSESLSAVLLQSPPPCISQWRKIFDDEPTIIRRAFYSLGNYLVASEIAKESAKSPVIVDRYWHSTAAYAIATEVSGGLSFLPPAHHPVYQWPGDLLKPDLVLLLTVNPEERARRLLGRGLEKTKEEAELEANNVFRQKVEMTYQRMENPSCHLVDASASRERVLQTVLQLIQRAGH
ncbi:UMP-CMP kinase 2, mitochondrial isoform X1 [Meriones unguiculatus]|uniref:UMP-CMP kinase 2, mitochondrial isoform X1 n=1 Tax=Meriones unguiculatus TaxID=10047 RepID=UPI000B4EB54D|nr:UMP-CMP kinase 2, mitochondrial isoform X1 [Meriones unguiculatus]